MAPSTSPTPRTPLSPSRASAASRAGLVSQSLLLPTLTTAPDPSTLLNALDKQQRTEPLDPIDFLNKHYSSESVLVSQLPVLREAVTERMTLLEERISNNLQRQSETAASTRQAVHAAKQSVMDLQNRIALIQAKAQESETAVLTITADMKKLDTAKQHLQRTITTLKRLHMLVHATEQLRLCSLSNDYATAAPLVDAIRLLAAFFESYNAKVESMKALSRKVQMIQTNLYTSFVHGVRIVAFGTAKTKELEGKLIKNSFLGDDEEEDEEEPPMSVDVLMGGVALVDALGEETLAKFIHGMCHDHLRDYVQTFEPPSRETKPEKRVSSFKVEAKSGEPSLSSLDLVEKRFLWFRKVMHQVETKFPKIFPPHWNFQASLARYFLQLTRDHILALLDGPRKDTDASNATILLKALQKTIIFEKDITGFLQKECGTVFEGADGKSGDSNKSVPRLIGLASGAFESYMEPYIRLEEQSMDEQLVEALEDRTVDTRGERPVFISSTNLFVYIKGSITRCTALTKGNAFLLLYQAFKDSLRKYGQILDSKLPPPIVSTGGISIPGSFGGKQDSVTNATYRLPKGEEVTVCHVISTCEYCADTMEALEDLIRDTIDEEYKTKIDMMGDQEVFHDITAKAIRVLVSGLIGRVDNALKSMLATNWAVYEAVGDESPYVRTLHEEIEPYVRAVRALLPTSYFRSFCDKFGAAFGSTYLEKLTRIKKINEQGTQQLLLDIYNLKTLLLKIPVLEQASSPGQKPLSASSSIAPAMYTKMIQKQFGKIETVLKLVGTPNELVIANFKEQWIGGTAADFQVVLSLKGLTRTEQAGMLEKFGVDPADALKGATVGVTSATIVSERVQALQDQGSTVAAKVNSDLSQMRQKVDDFRKAFRSGANMM